MSSLDQSIPQRGNAWILTLIAVTACLAACESEPTPRAPARVWRELDDAKQRGVDYLMATEAAAQNEEASPAIASGNARPDERSSSRALPLDLARVLQLAGSEPIAVKAALLRAREAAALEDEAALRFLPDLLVGAAFQHLDGETQSTEGRFLDVHKQNTEAGGSLALELSLGDAWYQGAIAEQNRRAAEFGLDAARLVSAVDAVDAYYDLLESRLARNVTTQARDHARALVDIQTARRSGGTGLQADVLRAEAFAASIDGRVAAAEVQVTTAREHLAAILLLPSSWQLTSDALDVTLLSFPEADDDQDLAFLALANRPDVASARARSAAAMAASRGASRSWLFPEIGVRADFGAFGSTPGSLRDREDVFVGVHWRLSARQFALARAADLRAERATLDVADLEVRIGQRVRLTKARIVAARAQLTAATRETTAAAAALDLLRTRRDAGNALLVEVLDAERADTEARLRYFGLLCEHNRAQLQLKLDVSGRL